MSTIEKVRELVTNCSIDGVPLPADDQPLFYDAKTMNDEQHRAEGGFGLDSLDRVELVMAIEENFSVEVPDAAQEHESFNTIAGIAAWIDQHQEGRG